MLRRDRVLAASRQYFFRTICRWARLARRFRTGILLLNSSKETLMKTRNIAFTVVLCLFALSLADAADANIGTGKLNEAKSHIPAGAPKNTTVVYSAAANDMITVTTDGVDGKGNPIHSSWTGKYDGKPYPVTGTSEYNMRTVLAKGERTLIITNLVGVKPVSKGKVEVGAGGTTRVLDIEGKAADG